MRLMADSERLLDAADHAGDTEEWNKLGLRERKKLLRMRRIMSAAHRLFVQKGFHETTIQDIAEAAGVGLGTLYLYARSKEDLLMQVFRERIVDMIDDSYQQVDPSADLLDQLMTFFDHHIDYHKRDPALSRTVLKELSFSITEQRKQDIQHITSATYERLRALVEAAVSNGRTEKELYPGTTAWSAFALYYHLLQGYLCGMLGEAEFRKNLRNALAMLLGR